jgi:hypothetical protein
VTTFFKISYGQAFDTGRRTLGHVATIEAPHVRARRALNPRRLLLRAAVSGRVAQPALRGSVTYRTQQRDSQLSALNKD